MQVAVEITYKINDPENWKARRSFYFDNVERVEIFDYNEFGNYSGIIHSKSYPLVRYSRDEVFKYRRATEEDLKEYCLMGEGRFYFPQVQRHCIEIGKGVCTK